MVSKILDPTMVMGNSIVIILLRAMFISAENGKKISPIL